LSTNAATKFELQNAQSRQLFGYFLKVTATLLDFNILFYFERGKAAPKQRGDHKQSSCLGRDKMLRQAAE